jgi:dipeptidase E
MRLLLIGATGSPYYEHCEQEIRDFLGPSVRIGIVPAANVFDEDAYFRGIEKRFKGTDPLVSDKLVHVSWMSNWREALNRVDALVIPGGNTYVLLKRLTQSGLLQALRDKISGGLPYIGSSAGANIVGPNILTTNDWNVVGLDDFAGLELVPFNINPHYVERGAFDAPNSETRDSRIREYHQFRDNPVVAIEETGVIKVVDSVPILMKGRAKIFMPDSQQYWMEKGKTLQWKEILHDASLRVAGSQEEKRLAASS